MIIFLHGFRISTDIHFHLDQIIGVINECTVGKYELLGLSDDDKENTVPAKRAKSDEIVDEVTKEPDHRLETLFPMNPLEVISQDFTLEPRSECEQHDIHITTLQ
ncbi:hypothetical protein JTB14_014965 [Gonioctena quinquepunctata]|nr:hypothetical protein JTB14_014965 [Gonioctena quinquepunctata]